MHAPADLPVALLALQRGLTDHQQLLAAWHAWADRPDRPLGEVLLERGLLSAAQRLEFQRLAEAGPTAFSARSPWLRYGVVPVAVAVALLCQLLLWPVVGPELSYLFFWLAVVFAAWYGGLGPGLLATFLSALTADFSLFWPRFSWAMVRPTDL